MSEDPSLAYYGQEGYGQMNPDQMDYFGVQMQVSD